MLCLLCNVPGTFCVNPDDTHTSFPDEENEIQNVAPKKWEAGVVAKQVKPISMMPHALWELVHVLLVHFLTSSLLITWGSSRRQPKCLGPSHSCGSPG